MNRDQYKVLGFIARNPNCKETEICVSLNMHIHAVWDTIKELQAQGLIESMGYASHVQEWHTVKSLTLEDIGRMMAGK